MLSTLLLLPTTTTTFTTIALNVNLGIPTKHACQYTTYYPAEIIVEKSLNASGTISIFEYDNALCHWPTVLDMMN